MALELKGLKGKAVKAGAMFDRLHRAYDKLIETGDTHAGDVESLAPQIDAMQEDITFSVQTLGNSVAGSNASEEAKEEPKQPSGFIGAEQQKTESAASPSPPAVGATATFQAATEQH